MRALFFALVLCSCGPQPSPVHPKSEEVCSAFCEVLTTMQCPGAQGSPGADEIPGTMDDPGCTQTCRDMAAAHTDYPMNRACLDSVLSCEAADLCVFGD